MSEENKNNQMPADKSEDIVKTVEDTSTPELEVPEFANNESVSEEDMDDAYAEDEDHDYSTDDKLDKVDVNTDSEERANRINKGTVILTVIAATLVVIGVVFLFLTLASKQPAVSEAKLDVSDNIIEIQQGTELTVSETDDAFLAELPDAYRSVVLSTNGVVTVNEVDTSKPGDYTLIFTTTTESSSTTAEAQLHVVDNTKPEVAVKDNKLVASIEGGFDIEKLISEQIIIKDDSKTELHIDDSFVDYEHEGTYPVIATITDAEGNDTVVDFAITIALEAKGEEMTDTDAQTELEYQNCIHAKGYWDGVSCEYSEAS